MTRKPYTLANLDVPGLNQQLLRTTCDEYVMMNRGQSRCNEPLVSIVTVSVSGGEHAQVNIIASVPYGSTSCRTQAGCQKIGSLAVGSCWLAKTCGRARWRERSRHGMYASISASPHNKFPPLPWHLSAVAALLAVFRQRACSYKT